MITKELAMQLRYNQLVHYTGKHQCTRTIGPRGGVKEHITCCRVSGQCKTWKRDPARFHIPVKYGLYESGYIDNYNCDDWHLASECPLLKREEVCSQS